MRPEDGHHLDDPRRAAILNIQKELQSNHRHFSSHSNASVAGNNPPRRRPIIIYTHPPRVYRTTPAEFKTLVQKLTGKPRSTDAHSTVNIPSPPHPPKKAKLAPTPVSSDSSSLASEYTCGFVGGGNSGFSYPPSASTVTVTSSAAHLETQPPQNSLALEFSHGMLEDDVCFGCNDSSTFWFSDRPSSDDGTLSFDY